MKIKLKIFLLMALMVGLVFYFKDTDPSQKITLKKQSTKIRKSIKESQFKISSHILGGAIRDKCLEPLNTISGNSLATFLENYKTKTSLNEIFGEECYSQLLKNKLYFELLNKSGCKFKTNETLEENSNCLSFIFHLKSFLIVESSKNKDITSLSALELAAHVAKMFFDIDKLNKESFKENLKVIHQLHELYPNDPDVVQAYAGYMIIGKMITKDGAVSDKIVNLLHESEGLDFKIDRMGPLDAFADDDLERAKLSLSKLESKYPNEADVSYYRAAYYWKTGDTLLTRAYLNRAIDKSVNCSYCPKDVYKRTLAKMDSKKPKDRDLFEVSIGLNFENL